MRELTSIPYVGRATAQDFEDLGFSTVESLRGQDPLELYQRLETLRGRPEDRCVLYVFASAIYYAQTDNPDPELVKWWNWKDRFKAAPKSPKPARKAPPKS